MMSILIFFLLTIAYPQKEDLKKNIKTNQNIERKIYLLEKRIQELERKITTLEKKLFNNNFEQKDEIEIKLISKETIENKNKGIIKIDAYLINNTPKNLTLIFGKLYIIDPLTKDELFSDNFYYEKILKPQQHERIIIAVPSNHQAYEVIKKRSEIIIKFIPKVVK